MFAVLTLRRRRVLVILAVPTLERATNSQALKLLDQAIAIEPDYALALALALALAAWCRAQQAVYNWVSDPASARSEALRLAQAASASGGSENDPTILTVLGAAHTIARSYAIAVSVVLRPRP